MDPYRGRRYRPVTWKPSPVARSALRPRSFAPQAVRRLTTGQATPRHAPGSVHRRPLFGVDGRDVERSIPGACGGPLPLVRPWLRLDGGLRRWLSVLDNAAIGGVFDQPSATICRGLATLLQRLGLRRLDGSRPLATLGLDRPPLFAMRHVDSCGRPGCLRLRQGSLGRGMSARRPASAQNRVRPLGRPRHGKLGRLHSGPPSMRFSGLIIVESVSWSKDLSSSASALSSKAAPRALEK